MATLHHILIPVKNQEQINKARDFFVNILGFKVIRESATLGKFPKIEMTEAEKRLPDYYCHLMDENNSCIDLVAFDEESPIKGIALGFQVDKIHETWDHLKDYPVKYIYDPISYGEWALKSLGLKSGYFAFFGLKMGGIPHDGEEQLIELIELNPE